MDQIQHTSGALIGVCDLTTKALAHILSVKKDCCFHLNGIIMCFMRLKKKLSYFFQIEPSPCPVCTKRRVDLGGTKEQIQSALRLITDLMIDWVSHVWVR